MDFFDGSLSEERSHLQRKRKKENSLSWLDSFDQEISRSNKKRKLGSESNSIRQNSQVDLYNLGEGSSKNNNVNNSDKNYIEIESDKEEKNIAIPEPEVKTLIKEKEVITNTPNGNEIPDNNYINNSKEFNINKEIINEKKENYPMIGLDNINGKSSYINSVIQCLSHTIPLTNYFLNENNKNRIIQNNISKSKQDAPQLSPTYLNIIENLWINHDQLKSFTPSELIKIIKLLNHSFEKDEENDVNELIIFILEQLNLELNNKNNDDQNNNTDLKNNNASKSEFFKELLSND